MTRLVLKVIGQSCDFSEGRNQILHPSREEREGFFVQDVLRRVAETNSVTADVEHQEASRRGG